MRVVLLICPSRLPTQTTIPRTTTTDSTPRPWCSSRSWSVSSAVRLPVPRSPRFRALTIRPILHSAHALVGDFGRRVDDERSVAYLCLRYGGRMLTIFPSSFVGLGEGPQVLATHAPPLFAVRVCFVYVYVAATWALGLYANR